MADAARDLVRIVSDKLLNASGVGLTDREFRQLHHHLYASGAVDEVARHEIFEALTRDGYGDLAAALRHADTITVQGAWVVFATARADGSPGASAKQKLLSDFVRLLANGCRFLPVGQGWELEPSELQQLRDQLAAMTVDDQCEVLTRLIRRCEREEMAEVRLAMRRAIKELTTDEHRLFFACLAADRRGQVEFADRFPAWVKDLGRWIVWEEISHLWRVAQQGGRRELAAS